MKYDIVVQPSSSNNPLAGCSTNWSSVLPWELISRLSSDNLHFQVPKVIGIPILNGFQTGLDNRLALTGVRDCERTGDCRVVGVVVDEFPNALAHDLVSENALHLALQSS